MADPAASNTMFGMPAQNFSPALFGAVGALAAVQGVAQFALQRQAARQQMRAAKYQQKLKNAEAENLDFQAGQTRAVSQREMLAQRQTGNLVQGGFISRAAASGASLSSPSVVSGLTDLAVMTDYNVGVARQRGEAAAASQEYSAQIARAEGQAIREAGRAASNLGQAQALNSLSGGFMKAGQYGAVSAFGFQNPEAFSRTGLFDLFGGGDSDTILAQAYSLGAPMYAKYGMGGPNA